MVFERSGMLAGTRRSRRGRTALAALLLLASAIAAPVGPPAGASIRRALPMVAAASNVDEVLDAAVADFNGDRQLDVLEVRGGGGMAVRWGTATDVYGEPIAIDAAGVSARRILSADMTSDGTADAVAFTPGGATLWVVRSNGTGGFLPPLALELSQGIRDVAIADFDRNGGRDIAVASNTTAEIVVFASRPRVDGYDARAFAIPAKALSLATIKLEADGLTDLVAGTADGYVRALRNERTGFSEGVAHRIDFAPELMATGDIDVDGWQDVVVASTLGKLAAFARVANAGLRAPVVSNVDAPLNKIELGYVDADDRMDVVGAGSQITLLFAGIGELRFDNPRHAIDTVKDVRSVTLARTSGGVRDRVVLARTSGLTVESVMTTANKLRGVTAVTNTFDEVYECDPMQTCEPPETPGMGCNPDIVLVVPAPAGSLRAVLDAAGPNTTITFALSTSDPLFSDATFTWHIPVRRALEVDQNGIEILGESQSDTNPFGPDVVIQPLNNQNYVAALVDEAPDPPLGAAAYAFEVTASAGTISTLIIGGTNFGGFAQLRVTKCNANPEPQNSDFDFIDDAFESAPIFINNGSGNVVRGCFMNTDERGIGVGTVLPFGEDSGGVVIQGGSSNRIGGDSIADRNIIVSATDGLRLNAGAGNMIIGNIIGTDGTIGGRPGGATPRNGVVLFGATGTEIRDNVIGGSAQTGILITNSSPDSVIEDNNVGVDSQGGDNNNSDGGIIINASDDTMVGPANVISNNGAVDAPNSGGVVVSATGIAVTGTVVASNTISNNSGSGVSIGFGDDSDIGPNNSISNNGFAGVAVVRGVRNTITLNSMTTNGTLGIDLVAPGDTGTGITPNDAGDADTGPNDLLNWPVLTGISIASGGTTGVTLTGTAPANSVVEIFRSDNAHPNGEGVEFLVSAVASGSGTFSVTLPVTLPVPDDFTLTATATSGSNTSEFSPNFNVDQSASVSPSSIAFGTIAVGTSASQTVTICNTGLSDLTIASVAIAPPTPVFTVSAIPADGATLSPGECTTVTVTFLPTSETAYAANVVITTDDPDTPAISIPVTGNSELGSISVDVASISIAQTNVGRSRSTVVNVRNTSNVPVTVSRVEFLRRGPNKIIFADRNDPFLSASPSTFTLQPGGSQAVTITFSPEAPIKSPDLTPPFELPTPAYQTPKNVKFDVRFVVSDSLGIGVTVLGRAKVNPIPGITDVDGPPFSDRLDLTMDVYDPDGNLTNAQFVFYNESLIQLFRIDDTPGVSKATRRFAKGMNVPLTFTFTGLAPFIDSLKFIDAVVIDAAGNRSEVIRIRVIRISKAPGGQFELVRDGAVGAPVRSPFVPGIALPPISIPPRQ